MEHLLKKKPVCKLKPVSLKGLLHYSMSPAATLWLGAITSRNLEIRRLRLKEVE